MTFYITIYFSDSTESEIEAEYHAMREGTDNDLIGFQVPSYHPNLFPIHSTGTSYSEFKILNDL